MPELCERCQHRRSADRSVLQRLSTPVSSPSARAAMQQQLDQLRGELRIEDLAVKRSVTTALSRRPVVNDWCAAQSNVEEMTFHFCDWLDAPNCAFFQPVDLNAADSGEDLAAADGGNVVPDVPPAPAVAVDPTVAGRKQQPRRPLHRPCRRPSPPWMDGPCRSARRTTCVLFRDRAIRLVPEVS